MIYPGWVNIDGYHEAADVKAYAFNLPYKNESIDKIYSSHMIEHLHPFDLERALKEWLRVLKKNGKVIIRCPNATALLQDWLYATDEERYDLQTGLRNSILGHHKSYNQAGHIHQNLFSEGLLKIYLEKAGFVSVSSKVCSERTKLLISKLQNGQDDEPIKVPGARQIDLWAEGFKQ